MSATDAKTFFDYLNGGLASATIKANGYEYALDALERVGWLTSATLVAVTAGLITVSFPSGAVRLLRVLYDNRELSRENRATLRDLGGPRWQDVKGEPIAFVEDDFTDRTFQLYPRATRVSTALSYPNNEPFGRDYPIGAIVTLTSDRTDPPIWFDVPCALIMMTYARSLESANQDLELAAACEKLAQLLTGIIDRA